MSTNDENTSSERDDAPIGSYKECLVEAPFRVIARSEEQALA